MDNNSNKYMEFSMIEEIMNRRSIRKYRAQVIENDKMERIKIAGQMAPTAKNLQEWKVIIVEDRNLINELVDKSSPRQPFLKQASVILAGCALNLEYNLRCGIPAHIIDLAIVLDHMSLQAVREGLGTCWIGSFYQDAARQILNIPEKYRIVELMSLGYPEKAPAPRPRKPLKDLYLLDKW
jgi:nitroreductase